MPRISDKTPRSRCRGHYRGPDREPAAVRMTGLAPSGCRVLSNEAIKLRSPRMSDAEALLDMSSTEEVSRFIPPPTSVDGFERFIAGRSASALPGVHRRRRPDGMDTAIGIFQVRQLRSHLLDRRVGVRDWPRFLGHRSLHRPARLTIDFAFDVAGVHRLEAQRPRSTGAATGRWRRSAPSRRRCLRRSFLRSGRHYDQALWSIVREDLARAPRPSGELRLH